MIRNNSVNDGGGIYAIFYANISDSNITNNSVESGGGGIFIIAGSPGVTIATSTISDNSAVSNGGGISSLRSAMSIEDSQVFENTAGLNGGGVHTELSKLTTVTRSSFTNNSATSGGGIWNHTDEDGTTEIIQSTIANNSAGGGGGIWNLTNDGGSTEIYQTTISGNSAASGGGIWNSGSASIYQSTITDNDADTGGGLFFASGTTVVDHTILAANTALLGPDLTGLFGAATDVHFSLIRDNSLSNLVEAPIGAPDINGNLIGDPAGNGVISPRIGKLASNGGPTETHALGSNSPALDAGNPSIIDFPEFDQRGAPFVRIAGDGENAPRIDIGAYERQSVVGLDSHYLELKASARSRLGQLYNEADYPATLRGYSMCSGIFLALNHPATYNS